MARRRQKREKLADMESLECNDASPLNFAHILMKILSYLPAKQLNKTARVSRFWKEISAEQKKRRGKISWFSRKLDRAPRTGAEDDSFQEGVESFIEDLWSEPSSVLVFCTSRMRYLKKRRNMHRDLATIVLACLPPACQMMFAESDGVIVTTDDNKTEEVERGHAMTMLFFPQNVDIYVNQMAGTAHNLSQLERCGRYRRQVIAVLLFSTDACWPEVAYNLHSLCPPGAAIAGGMVKEILKTGITETEKLVVKVECATACRVISGEGNLCSASVVITSDVDTKQGVEERLLTLKPPDFSPDGVSFAFMFACVGRGRHFYGVKNMESEIFRKLFPATPLFGLYVNGEVGHNKPAVSMVTGDGDHAAQDDDRNEVEEGVVRFPASGEVLYHSYSSVFCLIYTSNDTNANTAAS